MKLGGIVSQKPNLVKSAKTGEIMSKKRGAFGRGQDAGDELWGWRWLLLVLVAVVVLGKLAEVLGLI